ncbi:hypothetical protein H8L32_16620 [Undibacterium sp. CY18W]|uniref:Uncharacterized protein n=1 Tax=Undibacterium hunanense TaxID=2762292 RepID=A0ABR6ZTE5_9BURK|nr:hypothetical protein [Undibacterium hunanense]MBC3919117.1 hypothetical protein [Undibacterium hunanense]
MSDINRTSWDFLADTYWYVTYPDLPALQFSASDNLLNWKVDQTVWHISGYKNGYFWGVSSAIIVDAGESSSGPRASPQQRSMVGTVTANGQVQISFIRGGGLRESIVTGFGHMSKLDQQWVFQMQMATSGGGEETLHWANMLETKRGDPNWNNLPGVNCSVPSMLEGASYPQVG